MKFGVREICDVVLRAKAAQKIGDKIFYKNEPVIYFDTLKTSSMEGAATTVYAQGGRGNTRLVAWEGERTVTFTMEDALISPIGFMILSGAGLIESGEDAPLYVHQTEQTDEIDVAAGKITLTQEPYYDAADPSIYVMVLDDHGEIISEPYIAEVAQGDPANVISISALDKRPGTKADGTQTKYWDVNGYVNPNTGEVIAHPVVIVDYYVEHKEQGGVKQIEITADKFGGNYYLEASTLFRDTNGVDLPAEFIIPNCKIQSNFNFTMASSGDPSTFTFTMDAFPDYTRFNKKKKVLAAIQIVDTSANADLPRDRSWTEGDVNVKGQVSYNEGEDNG